MHGLGRLGRRRLVLVERTVKVEVPKTWKNAKDGFVYIDVVPNGKPFEVTK